MVASTTLHPCGQPHAVSHTMSVCSHYLIWQNIYQQISQSSTTPKCSNVLQGWVKSSWPIVPSPMLFVTLCELALTILILQNGMHTNVAKRHQTQVCTMVERLGKWKLVDCGGSINCTSPLWPAPCCFSHYVSLLSLSHMAQHLETSIPELHHTQVLKRVARMG